METALRDWSFRRWKVVSVGLMIAASVGGCFGRQNDDLSDDKPDSAADIRMRRAYTLCGKQLDDVSVSSDFRIVDPAVIRLATSPTILERVADNEKVASQPQVQQSEDPESFLRRHLKVTTPDANLLRIEFASGTEAERAAIANAVAEALMRENAELKARESFRRLIVCEQALEHIRSKMTDWKRAELRLRNQTRSVQVDETGSLIVFPSGLRQRYGALMRERITIDAQIAVAKEANEADEDTAKDLARKRRVVELELEQLKTLIVDEETFNKENSRRKSELSELQETIQLYTAWRKAILEKRENIRMEMSPPPGIWVEGAIDATALGE